MKGRGQVDAEPDGAAAGAHCYGGEHVLVFRETGGAHELHHGSGEQVVLFEAARHVVGVGIGVEGLHAEAHHLGHGLLGIVGHQVGQPQGTQVLVFAVGDEELVGVARYPVAQLAQVAEHHVQGDVGAHRHRVGVHQAAGGVLGIGEYGFQAAAVLFVQRFQDLARDIDGQFLDEVRQVVHVHLLGGVDDLFLVHVLDQLVAHILGELHEGLAVLVGVEQVPEDLTLGERQGFENVGHFRGRQFPEQVGRFAPGILVQ